ncbi:DUF4625 domain-containing protein [Parapedobacter sp. 10938]|uniref:DUF4625 domain-containing protein n=1 Tax=Parapedobacter flavus TaxID=3110225 RepID=UPI002DBF52F2|nr:DUF4625 domain-containing protein [Parapedobacter sp. 10938]MEC3878855.1 DUF4625 domain-containing protein [Parapedobacter sp. 10938]
MNKQNKHFIYILLGLTLFTWAACSKDESPAVDKPLIESLEVGHDNNRMVRPGGDLHLDAAILAPGGIAHITLEIHPEIGDGWVFEQVFTDGYEGLKNTDFHQHIDVPVDAAEGEYHLHVTVTDQAGQVAEAESHLDITAEAEEGHDDHHDH